MLHEDAFLRAIAASPDDDAPILVFADWLEERGDPRGQILRIQTTLPQIAQMSPRRDELEAQEKSLWREHAPDWLARAILEHWGHPWTARAIPVPNSDNEFWRICLGWDEPLPAYADSISRQPVRHFRLEFEEIEDGRVAELANCPFAICLTSLELIPYDFGGIRDTGAQPLVASPYLARIVSLMLACHEVTDVTVKSLAESSYLTRLAFLDLSGNEIRDDGIQALAASPQMSRLISLDLNSNERIGSAGALALAASPHLGRLTFLNLAINRIGSMGAQALVASQSLSHLAYLHVADNNLTEPDMGAVRRRFGRSAIVGE